MHTVRWNFQPSCAPTSQLPTRWGTSKRGARPATQTGTRSNTSPEDVLSLSHTWSSHKRERQSTLLDVFSNAALTVTLAWISCVSLARLMEDRFRFSLRDFNAGSFPVRIFPFEKLQLTTVPAIGLTNTRPFPLCYCFHWRGFGAFFRWRDFNAGPFPVRMFSWKRLGRDEHFDDRDFVDGPILSQILLALNRQRYISLAWNGDIGLLTRWCSHEHHLIKKLKL